MQLADVMAPHKVEIPEHLKATAEVPVISGEPQRQGDVVIVPMPPGQIAGLEPVPAEGIPVVRGEAGGNTHLLVAEGPVRYATREGQRGDAAVLGSLDVAEGGTAFLIHPEHGATGIGVGQYGLRRSREQADEIRLVRD